MNITKNKIKVEHSFSQGSDEKSKRMDRLWERDDWSNFKVDNPPAKLGTTD